MHDINLTLSVEAKQWEVLREQLISFSDTHQLSKHDQYYLLLICEEWFFNIVSHGFPPSHIIHPSLSTINVQVNLSEQQIEIIYVDEGVAFNPFEKGVSHVTASIEQELGGLGLYFIINLLSSYHYSYDQNKNKTTMYYAIKQREN